MALGRDPHYRTIILVPKNDWPLSRIDVVCRRVPPACSGASDCLDLRPWNVYGERACVSALYARSTFAPGSICHLDPAARRRM